MSPMSRSAADSRPPRGSQAAGWRRRAHVGGLQQAGRGDRPLCRDARAPRPGRAAEIRDDASARRLWPRRNLAISIDGRPIKIEGNPRHPASLGATDVFAEAAIMSLYDPDRSKAPRHGNNVAGWEAFGGAFAGADWNARPRGAAPACAC